ncbi:hypothetical protein KKG51_03735, partial [Patescibacteria group bacterium]|nr:hypothetical protein [Patescibacteria group bacterium]
STSSRFCRIPCIIRTIFCQSFFNWLIILKCASNIPKNTTKNNPKTAQESHYTTFSKTQKPTRPQTPKMVSKTSPLSSFCNTERQKTQTTREKPLTTKPGAKSETAIFLSTHFLHLPYETLENHQKTHKKHQKIVTTKSTPSAQNS